MKSNIYPSIIGIANTLLILYLIFSKRSYIKRLENIQKESNIENKKKLEKVNRLSRESNRATPKTSDIIKFAEDLVEVIDIENIEISLMHIDINIRRIAYANSPTLYYSNIVRYLLARGEITEWVRYLVEEENIDLNTKWKTRFLYDKVKDT